MGRQKNIQLIARFGFGALQKNVDGLLLPKAGNRGGDVDPLT